MSLSDYYRNARMKIRKEIQEIEADRLIHTEKSELMDYFKIKYQLPVLKKDETHQNQIESMKRVSSSIPVKVHYHIQPASRIEETATGQPSTWRHGTGINVGFDRKTCSFVGTRDIPISVTNGDKLIEEIIERIKHNIEEINRDVNEGNLSLNQIVSNIYDEFRKKRSEEIDIFDKWIEKIPIDIVRKDDAQIVPFEIKVKPTIKPIMPDPKKSKEFFLKQEHVDAIIELLENAGLSFERTPSVFSKLGEEDLRDILLSALNVIFGGSATGETFSKRGKTDIYLRFSEKDLLICECKFWSGETQYTNALEQLFRYMTWRESYGILITFSKRSEFSNVINNAMSVISQHSSMVPNSTKEISNSSFTTIHAFPNDKKKRIKIYHLLFNLSN